MRTNVVLILMLIAGFVIGLGAGFMSGYWRGYDSYEPKVVERYYHTQETITSQVVQPVYIDRPVAVDRPVFYDVPVPLELNRDFNSTGELEQWLKRDSTDQLEYVGVDGMERFDCDKYAYALQANADRDGYMMSVQVDDSRYGVPHAYNTVRIGRMLYAIEPQTDRVWRLIELD